MSKLLTVYNAGQLVGPVIIFLFNLNTISRRLGILFSIICQLISWVILAFEHELENRQKLDMVYFARFISGIGSGLSMAIAPLYIAEIAPPQIRNEFCAVQKYLLLIGPVIEYNIGPTFKSHEVALINFIICVLVLPLCWYMPNSPYYLLLLGKVSEAMESLKKLRPASDDVANEFEMFEMIKHVQVSGTMKRVFRAKNAWLILISIAVISTGSGYYVVTGFFHVLLYSLRFNSTITLKSCREFSEPLNWQEYRNVSDVAMHMENRDRKKNMDVIALYLLPCLIIATIFGSCLPMGDNRSVLVNFSSIIITFTCLTIATFYLLKRVNYCTERFVWVPIASFGIYLFVQGVGITGLFFIFVGEVFPTEVALTGSCLANIIYIIFMILNNQQYNFMVTSVGRFAAFYIFAFYGILGIVFANTKMRKRYTRFVEYRKGTLHSSRLDTLEKKSRIPETTLPS